MLTAQPGHRTGSSACPGRQKPIRTVAISSRLATRMGVSVARVSQIERGDVSTQDVLNRFVAALGGTLKLIADFGDEQLKIA